MVIQFGLYRHYKGNLYQLLALARHSKTLEEMVVYQALYGDFGVWVRPLSLFVEQIEHEGTKVPRFTFVGEGRGKPPSVR